jgi:hypothetical protein
MGRNVTSWLSWDKPARRCPKSWLESRTLRKTATGRRPGVTQADGGDRNASLSPQLYNVWNRWTSEVYKLVRHLSVWIPRRLFLRLAPSCFVCGVPWQERVAH